MRMPYAMHSHYLRRLFLGNRLAAGSFQVGGRPVLLEDMAAPFYVVATETDHVAPGSSVWKIHLLTDRALRFAKCPSARARGSLWRRAPPPRPHRQAAD